VYQDRRIDGNEFVDYFLQHSLEVLAASPSKHSLTELQALLGSVEALNRNVQHLLRELAGAMRGKGAVGW